MPDSQLKVHTVRPAIIRWDNSPNTTRSLKKDSFEKNLPLVLQVSIPPAVHTVEKPHFNLQCAKQIEIRLLLKAVFIGQQGQQMQRKRKTHSELQEAFV